MQTSGIKQNRSQLQFNSKLESGDGSLIQEGKEPTNNNATNAILPVLAESVAKASIGMWGE